MAKYKTPEQHVNRSMETNVQRKRRKCRTIDVPIRSLSWESRVVVKDKEVPSYQEWGKMGYEGLRNQFHYDAFITYWRSLEAKYPQKENHRFHGDDSEQLYTMNLRFLESIQMTSDITICGEQEKRAVDLWFKGVKEIQRLRKSCRNTQSERVTMEDGPASCAKWEMVNGKVKQIIKDVVR